MKTKLLGSILLCFLCGCAGSLNYSRIALNTVSVTRLDGHGGGSGAIVSHTGDKSEVLTNAHVCRAMTAGGNVNTVMGKVTAISSMKLSNLYDLCLVTVLEDLEHSAEIAENSPKVLDRSVVAGHPLLMPIVINEGHFSQKSTIYISDSRECTNEDLEDPGRKLFCDFVGFIPVISIADSIMVTNLIAPGSSGSAVYNSSEEISAVIFAGSEGLGYGFAVPLEQIHAFMHEEIKTLTPVMPITKIDRVSSSVSNQHNRSEKIKQFCKDHKDNSVCKFAEDSAVSID